MLDVKKLSLLREVAVHGGVTGAAQALHMSTSNVSQQLSRFERELNTELLEPSGRGVRLTPAAERLVAHAEAILEVLEVAEGELRDTEGVREGTVRLAAFHTFAVGLLAHTTERLRVIAPRLELDFTQLDPEAAIAEVLARRADIAVVDEYDGFVLPPLAGLVRVTIGNEPIHAYLPDGADDASQVDWAMEPPSSDAAAWARNVCRQAGFEPRVRFESPDPNVHRRLVEQGLAAALLPSTVARGMGPSTTIMGLPSSLHRRHVLILRRGSERTAAAVACRAAIEQAFREMMTRSID